MAQVQDGLNQTQAFALIFETTSTRNLLGYCLWALRNARFWETTRDPILTMLSIGGEKLLKMSLGRRTSQSTMNGLHSLPSGTPGGTTSATCTRRSC